MAGEAGNVQLRLQASLDLAYMRGQLAGLSSLSKSYPLILTPQVDSRKLAELVKGISRQLVIKVNDSQVTGLITRLDNAKALLGELQAEASKIEVKVSGQASVTPKEAKKIRAGVYRGIMANGGKILLPVGLQPISDTAVSKFKADLQQKLGSITIEVEASVRQSAKQGAGGKSAAQIDAEVQAGLRHIQEKGAQRFAGTTGVNVTEAAVREQLRSNIRELTVDGLKKLAKQMQVTGYSGLRKDPLIDKIVAEASYEMIKRHLNVQGMMQSPNRGPLQQVMNTVARGWSKVSQVFGGGSSSSKPARMALPEINWPAQRPTNRPPIGPSSTGRLLLGDLLSPSLKGVLRDAANAFADSVRREMNTALRQVKVEDLGTRMRTALPQARIAGLLPEITQTRADFFAARTAQAYARSDLRSQEGMRRDRRRGLGGDGGGEGGDGGDGGRGGPPLALPGGPEGPRPRLLAPARDGDSDPRLTAQRIGQLRQYATALQVARQSMGNFRASQLPLLGGLRELTGEFANATKQVLLYGTAYRGLTFLAALPGNMLNAAKAQQQYNNALQVATQESGTYAKELLFVENVQRAFGLNLQTTRDGFVRLYASMSPAGFDSGSIEKLFTGISAATAALQLTPDRAERVIYAFGQMASKGQVMSEELKGQLGDVLPGALAIFAKAAGKSVKEFNADLEKGVYSGNRFRELMASVTDELINRFSSGAVVAGRSLQGMLNMVQSDFQRTLESLAPLADAAAKALLLPVSGGLRQFSAAAQIATGELDRLKQQMADAQQVVKDVRDGGGSAEQIRAAEQNVMALQARYEVLNRAMQNPAIAKQAADIQRFTAELAKAGTFVLNMAKTIGSVLQPVLAFFGTNLTSVIGTLFALTTGFQVARVAMMAGLAAMTLIRVAAAAMGLGQAALSAQGLAAAFRALGVQVGAARLQVVGLNWALGALVTSTVIGAAIAGLGLLIGHFVSMGNAAQEAGEKAKAAMEAVKDAALTGNVALIDAQLQQAKLNAIDLGTAERRVSGLSVPTSRGGDPRFAMRRNLPATSIPAALRASLTTLGVNVPTSGMVDLNALKSDIQRQQQLQKQQIPALQAQRSFAATRARAMGIAQSGAVPSVAEADPAAEASRQKALDQARSDLERLMRQQQQLLTETAAYQNKLDETAHRTRMELAEQEAERQRILIDSRYEQEIAGANEVQAVRLRLEQKLTEARIKGVEAVRNALAKIEESRMKVVAAQRTEAAAAQARALEPEGGGGPPMAAGAGAFDTGMRTGPSHRIGGSTEFHQDLMFGPTVSLRERVQYMDQLARKYESLGRVIEFSNAAVSGERYRSTSSYEAKASLITRAEAAHYNRPGGSRRRAMDFYAPLAGETRHGPSVEGQTMFAPTVPGGQVQYDTRSGRGMTISRNGQMILEMLHGDLGVPLRPGAQPASGPMFAMQRTQAKAGFGVEEAKAEDAATRATALSELATKLLQTRKEVETAIVSAIGTAMPVEQLKLENQQLMERNRLLLAGKPEEVVAMEEKTAFARGMTASIQKGLNNELAANKELLAEYEAEVKKNTASQEVYSKAIANVKARIQEINAQHEAATTTLREYTKEQAINALETLKNADALEAMKAAVAMVEQAVSDAMSSYKGFVLEVLKGGDIRDAVQKLQSALSDQVLTMFIDFSMKPVQQFFEKELKRMFNLPDEEAIRQQSIKSLQNLVTALDNNTAALTGKGAGSVAPAGAAPGSVAPFKGGDQSFNIGPWLPSMAGSPQVAQLQRGSGQAFPLPATFPNHGFPPGTFKVFEDALRQKAAEQAVPPALTVPTIAPPAVTAPAVEALEPVKEVIQETGKVAEEAAPKLQANAEQFKFTMGSTVQAFGMAVGAITSIVAGISQMKKGGVSGVLGGLGSIFMGVGGAIGGFSNMFKPAVPAVAPAAAATGFKLFANGGVVHGPTLGMIGEGRYSEAVVPLPDGRTIPVQMRNSASRDLLNERSSGAAVSPILSMSFQSTRFGGKDYVDVEQLEQAMAETERRAVRGGATRGASLALDRLQHSPTTRKKVGLR